MLRLGLCTFTTAVAACGGSSPEGATDSVESAAAAAAWALLEKTLLVASGSAHPLKCELVVVVWSFLLQHGSPSLVRPHFI